MDTKIMHLVTIDGPAGSGKSTVAKLVAEKLGWIYVSTGAIYRTFALLIHEAGLNPSELCANAGETSIPQEFERYISFLNERYRQESATGHVFIGERDITLQIRENHISNLASVCSQNPILRHKLLPLQRRIVLENNGAVVDGRDMGTVVFPDAPVKIFLTASVEERARRRLKELASLGVSKQEPLVLEKVLKDIEERDKRDEERAVAPLKPATDAFMIDSTNHTVDEITDMILKRVLK